MMAGSVTRPRLEDTINMLHTGTRVHKSVSFFFNDFACFTGSAAVHKGAEGVDERGAGRHAIGQSAEGGRGRSGQDET